MAVSAPFTGGCACGAIRYESAAPPLLMWNCHCRDCQRASGSAFAALVYVPTPAFRFLQGEPRYHTAQGLHGTVQRGFCPACGSPIAVKPDRFPDFRGVSAASLDDPRGVTPLADLWTSSAHPWDVMNPNIPKFEQGPTEEQWQALMTSRS